MATTDLRRLKILGRIEGTSLLVLVGIAMPLKHLAHLPMATRIVGLIHGLAFLAYVVTVFDAFGSRRLSGRETGLAILAALIPGGTFYYVRSMRKTLHE